MAQQPQSLPQIYKKFTNTFSETENPRDIVRFAKRRLSVDLKYGDVKKFLTDKKKWDERICEPFDSEFGQDWYRETIQHTSYYQKWLIDCYFKQKHHTTCSLVSIGIILNAKLLSNYYLSKYDPDDEQDEDIDSETNNDNKFEFDSDDEEDINTLKSILPFLTESKLIDIFPNYSSRVTIDKVLVEGMSLDELGQVLLDFGCKNINIIHCNDNHFNNINKFRNECLETFSKHNMDIDKVIICNFDLWELDTGIEGGIYGHISPLAAYHQDSDRVLLLDTFVDESWVKIDSLYKAMNTQSDKTSKFRGYIIVEMPPIWGQNNKQKEVEEGRNNTNTNININNNNNNNNSVEFDFIVLDDNNSNNSNNNNNNNNNKRKKQRRNSRRMSKKLQLYLEFDSDFGQQLWKETQCSNFHQKWCVVEYFQQNKSTTYGFVTFCIIFNARIMCYYHNNEIEDNDYDYKDFEDNDDKFNEDKIISLYTKYYINNINNTNNINIPKIDDVISNGMSLQDTKNILQLFGCKTVKLMHSYEIELDDFRNLVKNTLKNGSKNNDNAILINYDLLNMTGIASGSIAVIAAYNIKNDMMLLMNTNWIIGKCWVKTQLLYDAMNTIDDQTGKYRGCIIINGIPLFN